MDCSDRAWTEVQRLDRFRYQKEETWRKKCYRITSQRHVFQYRVERQYFRIKWLQFIYDKSISLIIWSPAKAFISISSTSLFDRIGVNSLEKLVKLAFLKMLISLFERSKMCTVAACDISGIADKSRYEHFIVLLLAYPSRVLQRQFSGHSAQGIEFAQETVMMRRVIEIIDGRRCSNRNCRFYANPSCVIVRICKC